jgi:hypothetical protein
MWTGSTGGGLLDQGQAFARMGALCDPVAQFGQLCRGQLQAGQTTEGRRDIEALHRRLQTHFDAGSDHDRRTWFA